MPEFADKDIGTVFKTVGMTLLSTVGGAGGPLYGTFFLQMGMKSAGKMELSLEDWTVALEAGIGGVIMRGKAELGDKTMVDALTPALNALKQSVQEINLAMQLGAATLSRCSQRRHACHHPTWSPAKGRASYLGERSAGHQDPGATSSYLILKTAAETWA